MISWAPRARNYFFIGILLCHHFSFLASAETVSAQVTSPTPSQFTPSPKLQPYVDFWNQIFTKYGEKQMMFHHRDHPGIVYSALDFSDIASELSGGKFTVAKERRVAEEISRIQGALKQLSDGAQANDVFTHRIQVMFRRFGKDSGSEYRAAMEEKQIRSQTGIRERFREGVRRSGRYLYAIEEIFRRAGLPVELARLPLVESSFDYTAYSSVGAAGIWQFMRSTGKTYLHIGPAIDERRDPIISSRAAARYLAHAHGKLEAWPLAITSYNHGITGMLRASKAAGSKDLAEIIEQYDGESFGFASKNFYAEFLAALEVEQNWKVYFPDLVREEPWYFDEVQLGQPEGYRDLIKASQVAEEDFQRLNPALLKPIISGRVKIPSGFTVKVPRGKGEVLTKNLKHGSVVSFIAGGAMYQKFVNREKTISKKSTTAVVRKSSKKSSTGATAGSSAKAVSKKSSEAGTAPAEGKYRIVSGDSLYKISKKTGVKLETLKRLNPQAGKKIKPGQEINLR